MCGINGFTFKDRKLIRAMNKRIAHRGPEDTGMYDDAYVSLGHNRLVIIDLTKAGAQPMYYTHEGRELIITLNGEIYNFRELKKDLIVKGYEFESDSDTEVVMAAYLEWGEECVHHFNGMWALCIYDKTRKQLFLSKDRLGKKPIYYYFDDKQFIFSSEIKGLLEHPLRREINKEALREYFTYRFTFGDKTMLKDIYSFNPGSNMLYDLKTHKMLYYKRYYSVDNLPKRKRKLTFEQAKKELYKLMDQSVKRRMVADVPVASFLSGGIDSSVITYLASKYNDKLNTFSIGFDTTNELSYAKQVAKHFGTIHHEYVIHKEEVLDYLEDMIYHMDEPIGADPGFFPIFILSKEVKKHNKVVLSGDGADEIFIGYDRYKLFHYGKHLSSLVPLSGKNEILKRLKAMAGKNPFQAFIEITRVFEQEELEKMKIKEHLDSRSWNTIKARGITQAQIFDLKTLLPKDFFMKSDKMGHAFGVEQRSPFMDYRVIDFALSLPISYKLKGWNEKYILKETFKKYLPSDIAKRRKHGFNVPIDYWFEHQLGDKLEELIKNNNHGLYKTEYALDLLRKLKLATGGFKSKNIIAQKLWTILVFEMWYERYLIKWK